MTTSPCTVAMGPMTPGWSLGDAKHAWPIWLSLAAFFTLVLVQVNLPGLYMDAVNPDFVAAQLLHHNARQPSAGIPSKVFPILGGLYYGAQNVYVGLPIFAVFGFSVVTLRVAQALFGAILVAALFVTTNRLTRSRALACACTLGLATELAFSASFRTQFYIQMGGAAWLVVALAYAMPINDQPELARRRTLLSGVFTGLACYGYFVLGFFVPGLVLLIAWRRRGGWRDLPAWLAGLILGLTPYALGYLSLLIKLKGIAPTLAFIHNMLGELHPFEASGATGNNIAYAWNMTRLAVTDQGNESMIFGQKLESAWSAIKYGGLVFSLLIMSGLLIFRLIGRKERLVRTLPVLLPWSFLAVASLFGTRLWAHHFSVLVPFVYLLGALLLLECLDALRASPFVNKAVIAVALGACLACNLVQQADFHRELARTGGTGKMPEALNTLAEEARGSSAQVAYLFPEWGFYTSFSFLTGNRVRYVDNAEGRTLMQLRSRGYRTFRLAFWNAADSERYSQILFAAGAQNITERVYTRRDGVPAFYLIEAE
ncbi:glycosyltransferase family 39 protein [Dyella jiangningensis]|uniref:Glycosyltransferase RgtA/B/C/D-like domain-containing protein n=1 Tax=Dyella jiangningensis TaxID=1379159 RepID=A0A328NWW0_9GAMM|nr:glycosyltransferase family 39 protein [Dyella jiangningensis]RAO74790.1 hypothetical protein CA260_18435 [Dyella jiangningensis]